jgi:superfamily II DNA/RNA helicase
MTHDHSSFHGLGIVPKLLDVFSKNRYTAPTPIQQQCIPFAIEQKDVIGIAQTGRTGKTLPRGRLLFLIFVPYWNVSDFSGIQME